jgi:hypothetical protein
VATYPLESRFGRHISRLVQSGSALERRKIGQIKKKNE